MYYRTFLRVRRQAAKKEHKVEVKFFLEKLSASRNGPERNTETRKRLCKG